MGKRFLFVLMLLVLSAAVLASGVVLVSNSHLDEDDPELYSSLGDFLASKGMDEEAIGAYRKAASLASDPRTYNNLATLLSSRDPEEALSHLEKAVELDPTYEMARKNLAALYARQKRYTDAIEHYRKLVEEHPEEVAYAYDLAVSLGNRFYHESRSKADLDESLALYEAIESLSPGFERTRENMEVLRKVKEIVE